MLGSTIATRSKFLVALLPKFQTPAKKNVRSTAQNTESSRRQNIRRIQTQYYYKSSFISMSYFMSVLCLFLSGFCCYHQLFQISLFSLERYSILYFNITETFHIHFLGNIHCCSQLPFHFCDKAATDVEVEHSLTVHNNDLMS